MHRPIVLIHRGCPDYLKIVLAQARRYNADSPVILLGDSSNQHLTREISGLEFVPIQCDTGDSGKFAKVFHYQSAYGEEFERFCIQRWILLRDLMRQRHWDRLLYLDSDVLLYSNIEQTGTRFDNSDMSLAHYAGVSHWCGHTNFINHPDVLGEFVDDIFELYTTEQGKRLREKIWSEEGTYISDMTCLGLFRQKTSRPIADLTQVVENSTFDDFFTRSKGYEKASKLLKKDLKRVTFKDSLPYCRLQNGGERILFHALHFHGSTKYMIKHFAKNHLDVFAIMAMIHERTVTKTRQLLTRKT
jgi:hypothetical protein